MTELVATVDVAKTFEIDINLDKISPQAGAATYSREFSRTTVPQGCQQ
jgi:hypothetical protein